MGTELFNTLAYRIVTIPDFYDTLQAHGVSVEQWPQCSARELVERFFRVRDDLTEFEARQSVAEALQSLAKLPSLPDTTPELCSLYDRVLVRERAIEVARKIIDDPDSYFNIIRENQDFQRAASDEEDVYSAASMKNFAEWFEQRSAEDLEKRLPDFPQVSDLIGGFNPQRISLLVAESGVGKTTFAMALAASASKVDPVLFVNMEMGFHDMYAKLIRAQVGTKQKEFNNKESGAYITAMAKFMDLAEKRTRLIMTKGRVESLVSIETRIRRNVLKNGVKFVVIDYDQKIAMNEHEEEWRALLKTFVALEQIAIQNNLHILILAQGNEEGIPKASKRSMQPVSSILWLFEKEGRYFVTAKKNRWGKKGATWPLEFNGETGEFREISPPGPETNNSLYRVHQVKTKKPFRNYADT